METEPAKQKNGLTKGQLASLAFELGFIIALPIVAFGFAGKWLDARYGTEPLFTLVGIIFAIASTSVWIYKKFMSYYK